MDPAQPFHIGPTDELFGLYHAAGAVHVGVLLCPPLGQDMIRSHRIYRQLADALASHGIAALRFDYYGSGDSAGDSSTCNWNRCLEDTRIAAAELRARSGCSRVIGFGARLGGGIALSSAKAARFSELLLWDPLLDGAACVANLDAMQETLRVDPKRFSEPRTVADAAGQWLGFPVSGDLRRQLTAWHSEPPTIPTHVFGSPARAQTWAARLGNEVRVTELPSTASWDDLDWLEHAILSPALIRAVGEHLRVAA